MRTSGSVRLAAFVALTLLILVASCTDGGAPISPEAGDGAVGLVLERSLLPLSAEAPLPINRIRAVARLVPGGEVVGQAVVDVNPNDASWALELDLDLGAIVSATVQVTFELINVSDGGVETVQFSGQTGPISVIPGRATEAEVVEIVRGGLGNLGVTSVQIPEPLAALVEGTSRGLTAAVTTSQPSLQPTVFWSSLDATATVSGSTVTGVLPGTARIVAAAGSRADTAVLTILARPTATRVSPDSVNAGLGATVTLAGTVLDRRGAPISGQALLWRSLTPTLLESLGGGSFRTIGAGRGLAEVRAAADTLLKDTAVVRVSLPATDVGVAKTAGTANANEGDVVTFTVTVANASAVAASGVRVSEELPAGMTLSSTTPSTGTFNAGIWTVGNLAAGASATLQVRATVNAGTAGTTLTNVVRVQALDGQVDQNAANDQASATVGIAVRTADLSLVKEVADGTLVEGDTARFTVTVVNRGPAAVGSVVVSDDLPAGLTYLSHSESNGSFSAANGAWTVGELPPGGAATLVMRARVASGTSGQTLVNRARITGLSGAVDAASANDTSSASVTVGGAASTLDVAVGKSVDDATPVPGQTVTFTVTVQNNGPLAATGITVSDTLPGAFINAQWVTTSGSYEAGLWVIPAIAAGEADTLVITAEVAADSEGQTYTNVARLLAVDQDDVLPSNDVAQVNVIVGAPVGGPVDHFYRTVGNTALTTGSYGATYLHLTDPNNALSGTSGLTVTTTGTLETYLGGTVIMEADGDFAYLPPRGVVSAVDSVAFETIDGGENGGSAFLVFTIESTRVWYVDNTTDTGSDAPGTSWEPIYALIDAEEYAGYADVIYVAAGSQIYDAFVGLKSGQALIGSHAGLDVSIGDGTATIRGPTEERPWIRSVDGTAIEMSDDNVVRGVGVMESLTGIYGNEGTNGAISDVELLDNYKALVLDYTGGSYVIEDVQVTSSTETGISLENTTGSYGITNLTIVHDGYGAALEIIHGNADIDVNGTIRSDSLAGRPISIGFTEGPISIAGTIEGRGSDGIEVYNVSGSLTIDAAIGLSHITDNGFLMYESPGTVRIAGGLVIEGTNDNGLEAWGGGTLEIVGASNRISGTACSAVYVEGVQFGGAGVTFESVSSDGECTGIYLSDTAGDGGGFTITGVGEVDGSGGLIRNSADTGIQLFSASDVRLANMEISAGVQGGIYADEVTDLVLTNVTVTDNGPASYSDAIYLQNVTGVATLAEVTAFGPTGRALVVDNNSGTLELSIYGLDAEGGVNDGDTDVVVINTENEAVIGVLLDGAAIHGGAKGLKVWARDASSLEVTVQGSAFTDLEVGIDLYQGEAGTLTYHLTENTFVNVGTGIYAWAGNFASGGHTGLIEYNDNDAGTGIEIEIDGTIDAVVAIHDEVIGGQSTDAGIRAAVTVEGSLSLTLIGNDITVNDDANPIDIVVDGSNSQNPASLCLDLRDNQIHTSYSLYALRQQGFSTFQIRGLPAPVGDETVVANVVDFLFGQNPQWLEQDAGYDVSGDYGTAEACGLPPGYQPPPFVGPPPSPEYNAIGNTQLTTTGWGTPPSTPFLAGGPGVLDGTTGLTVSSLGPVPTELGGTVLMEPDGDFHYTPPVGTTGTSDQFTYSVEGGGTGQVTIDLSDVVWYVNNSASNGDGRSHSPFVTIANALGAADGTPATFHVASGAGTYTEAVSLSQGQRLIGEGVGLSVGDDELAPAGNTPRIRSTSDLAALTLSGANEVAGLEVRGDEGDAIFSEGADDVQLFRLLLIAGGRGIQVVTGARWTMDEVSVENTAGDGISIAGASDTWQINQLHVENTGGTAFLVDNFAGAMDVTLADGSILNETGDGPPVGITGSAPGSSVSISGGSIVANEAGGIVIAGNEGNVTIESPIGVTNPSTDALLVANNTGLITIGDATISATAGDVRGLTVLNSTVDMVLSEVVAHDTLGGGSVLLNAVTGPIYIDRLDVRADGDTVVAFFAQGVDGLRIIEGGAIGTSGAQPLFLSEVTADIQLDSIHRSGPGTLPGAMFAGVSGTIEINAGSIRDVEGTSFLVSGGDVSMFYGGSIEHGSFDNSVLVQGSTGGTVWFAGSIMDVAGGIYVTGNTNGTEIYFSGAIDVSTNEGNIPFHAEDNPGAQVRIQSNAPSVFRGVNVPSAVRIVNTDIDGNGIEIDSVFASSVTTGIEIDGVGVGQFEVMGGQIQGDEGVSITDFSGALLDLNGLDITAWGDAIRAVRVKDLTISGNTIADAGNEIGGQGIDVTSPSGTLTIDGTTVTGSANENVLIQSNPGEQVAIEVTGSFIEAAGNNGFDVTALGNADVSINVSSTEFDSNGTSALRSALHRNGMMVRAFGTSTVDVTVRDNTLFDSNLEHGLVLLDSANAVINVDIGGSTFRQNGNTTSNGYGLLLLADHGTTSSAGFRGDLNSNAFEDNYSGGVQANLIGDARNVLRVLNNTVDQQDVEEGMMFRVGEPTNGSSSEAALDVTFNGNVVSVANGLTSAADGILLRSEGFANLCVAGPAGSNTVTVDVLDAGVEAFATAGSTFRVENLIGYQTMRDWLEAVFQITTGDANTGKTTGTFTPVATGTCATP